MHPREADLDGLLQALVDAGVEFIVVGGAAAVLHGAPTATQDLDIVHRRTPDNVDRLFALLETLDAYVREPTQRKLRPVREYLAGNGQLNLTTALGPLDPLCRLHDGRGFDELVSHTVVFEDGSMRIRVIDLDTLIEIKAGTGRAKDTLLVPVLMALRDELAR
jgi:hypothetical protein